MCVLRVTRDDAATEGVLQPLRCLRPATLTGANRRSKTIGCDACGSRGVSADSMLGISSWARSLSTTPAGRELGFAVESRHAYAGHPASNKEQGGQRNSLEYNVCTVLGIAAKRRDIIKGFRTLIWMYCTVQYRTVQHSSARTCSSSSSGSTTWPSHSDGRSAKTKVNDDTF